MMDSSTSYTKMEIPLYPTLNKKFNATALGPLSIQFSAESHSVLGVRHDRPAGNGPSS